MLIIYSGIKNITLLRQLSIWMWLWRIMQIYLRRKSKINANFQPLVKPRLWPKKFLTARNTQSWTICTAWVIFLFLPEIKRNSSTKWQSVSQRYKSIFKKGFQVFHGFIFVRVSLERVIHDLFQGIHWKSNRERHHNATKKRFCERS